MEKVATVDELEKPKCVTVKGKALALFRVNGKVYCIDNTCPHASGPLCEGEVDDGKVICPWHGWTFDLATGDAVSPAYGSSVVTHKVEVNGNDVYVDMQ